MKNDWVKPELIVLVRGSNKERVLTGCKWYGGNGADSRLDGCNEINGSDCVNCCDFTGS